MIYSFHSPHCDAEQTPHVPLLSHDETWCRLPKATAGSGQPLPSWARAVAERTRRLASADWSAFPAEEQRAYAYARKLSKAPWTLTAEDYRTLEQDLGPAKAMSTFWWLCRGLYMTRISDGFQLPLERENVFSNH